MAILERISWLAQVPNGRRWLVAVSGGADSVALLHLVVERGWSNLVVCHLDHRLRGRASTEDGRFVGRLAAQLGLQYELGRDDVRARMKQRRESLETAARRARHEFWARCAAKYRCRRILLGHQADDQAETALWNLLRGSHGLKGMREEQAVQVGGRMLQLVRPLLGVRHAELVEWLQAGGHRWREDASNVEPVAVRNRLRHEVFPLLSEIAGRDAVAAFVRGAADAAEHEDAENAALDQAHLLDPQGRLYLPGLRQLAPGLQRAALHRFLRTHGVAGIDRGLLERAASMIDPTQPAVINLAGGRHLRRREGRLWIDG